MAHIDDLIAADLSACGATPEDDVAGGTVAGRRHAGSAPPSQATERAKADGTAPAVVAAGRHLTDNMAETP